MFLPLCDTMGSFTGSWILFCNILNFKIMKRICLILFCLTIIDNSVTGQVIDKNSFGVIMNDSFIAIGSAFIVGMPNIVVSCDHVGSKNHYGKKYFQPGHTIKNYELTQIRSDSSLDLICYSVKETITNKPLNIDSSGLPIKLDSIFYLGCDFNKSSIDKYIFFWERSKIISPKRQYTWNHVKTECIEYIGKAIGGYSGGPVFNLKGNVVGLISQKTEMFIKKGNKIDTVSMNRAYSILPIIDWLK